MSSSTIDTRTEQLDAVVVGAGFAGLYMVHALRGLGLRVVGVEAGSDVGGTWFWNRYPGARCDAASIFYSFSFDKDLQQEWSWSERYAMQPEILDYLRFVADRLDLRSAFRFDTRVVSAVLDDDETWTVQTDTGDVLQAQYCIMATGCLSRARVPDVPGLGESSLQVLHTGDWPHEGKDVAGLRVGVIGTGSSAIQAIPRLAAEAESLTAFQRTANYSVPARNAPTPAEQERRVKAQYPQLRERWRRGELVGVGEELSPGGVYRRPVLTWDETSEQRQAEYGGRWETGGAFFIGAYGDMLIDSSANEVAAQFVRDRIAELVDDPATAETLTPRGHPIGTKRICVDSDYFATYNRPNVTLIDVAADPIAAVDDTGVLTASGEHFDLDLLVCATGFDAMTGALLAMDIVGRDGLTLADEWAEGPRAFLGLNVHGFPNLFTLTGPGSPSVLGNVVAHIEQHVEFVTELIEDSRRAGVPVIEAEPEAQMAWSQRVNDNAAATLMPTANSWYLGANVPGKPRVFMPFVGGLGLYRQLCDEVRANGYAGFDRRPSRAAALVQD